MRSIAVDGHRSLIYMLDQTRAALGPQSNLPEPLPAPSRVHGIEFIEFAIDEASAPRLEALIGGLGFARSGRHVSKSVTRWTQGSINLVVNTETEGFAHSFNIVHGPGVCAIGLKVDDSHATLARASCLLDTPFAQPVGPGELEIPAVRGLGGSLVYFTDPRSELARVWDIEFRPIGSPAQQDRRADLASIDHISQSMQYEEMLTWLLFYTSLFEVTKLPVANVLDPGGVVKSQVIEAGGDSLRLILNASQSGRTLSSRFLTEMFGSGVQHIAFATDNIFAAAERITAAGVKLLAIPENYYDDLEAKGDLAPDQLQRLKASNILYERDGAGEFFQMYTQTFDELFFFEIVERRGGYRGYGATNAQIRLTAQSRAARRPDIPRR